MKFTLDKAENELCEQLEEYLGQSLKFDQTGVHGCDNTRGLTESWLRKKNMDVENFNKFLDLTGGDVDCEGFLNTLGARVFGEEETTLFLESSSGSPSSGP